MSGCCPAARRTRWLPLTVIAATAALLAACAGREPDIQLDQLQVELGQVVNGEVRTLEVPLRNQGEVDLVIQAVTTSCGCTTAQVEPSTVKPGERALLRISFDSGAHGPTEVGPVMRQVFIASNDPDQPEVELRFTAEILPPET